MKLSYHAHVQTQGVFSYQKLYKCERGRRTWFLTPLCVKLGKDFHDFGKADKTRNRIRFCSALYQVCIYFIPFYCWFIIYLFIYLSIYCIFFHSPFMNSGLGSEGNHIATSHHHPNFPGVPPGAAGRVQWQTKNNNKCLNISRYSITRQNTSVYTLVHQRMSGKR